MNKYYNRVQSEFEKILLELSYDSSTSYKDAYKKATEYTTEFSKKKNLSDVEKETIMEFCVELIDDWFPDITYFSTATF
jgi:hypothetical protein